MVFQISFLHFLSSGAQEKGLSRRGLWSLKFQGSNPDPMAVKALVLITGPPGISFLPFLRKRNPPPLLPLLHTHTNY